MPDFTTAVSAAGEEHVVVNVNLGHSLADVLEETLPGVFTSEGVETLVMTEIPDLDSSIHGPCHKHRLILIQRETLDGVVVGLEGVDELVLPEVPDTDLAFLACRDDELVLRGVD